MTFAMRLNGGDLIRDGEKVKHDGFTVTVMKDGTGFGKAEPLFKTIHTLMTNGSQERISGFGNRAPAIMVKIEGETPDGLNAGGVWLSSLMRPGALEWLPPDQTVWTVFDVVTCYVDRTEDEGWDFKETQWIRKYRIPIKALPHSRSRFRTITPALPLASTPIIDELLDDGSSVADWTSGWRDVYPYAGEGALTPTTSGGWVKSPIHTVSKERGANHLWLKRVNLPALAADTPYIRADIKVTNGQVLFAAIWPASGSGNASIVFSDLETVSPGVQQGSVYFLVPEGTTALQVQARVERDASGSIEIDQLRRVSRLPDLGTDRQKLATVTPGGSAPAEGSIHVGHDTAGLGKVLLHTFPLGRPTPDLMSYRTAGQTPADDDDAISGQTVEVPYDLVLDVPDPHLPVRGRAALWAKLSVDTAAVTLRWLVIPYATTPVSGEHVGPVVDRTITLSPGEDQLVPLGLITLPGTVIGSCGFVQFRFQRLSGSGSMRFDKVWAFGQDEESSLTVVDAGVGTPESGGPSNHLWINAPTSEKPAGEVLIGTSLADARWPKVIQAGPEVHRFGRDGVACLTVACGASDAWTEFDHFKRWDHFAAEEQ